MPHARQRDRALVDRLWRAYQDRHRIASHLSRAVTAVLRALAEAAAGTPVQEPHPPRSAGSPLAEPKPTLNGPRPCGSGKKYKRCHGTGAGA